MPAYPDEDSEQFTQLLVELREGSQDAEERLYVLVRGHLKRMASARLRDRKGHTFDTTELVHEAWMRLFAGAQEFSGREHFLAIAARAMRALLADHARKMKRDKRGGQWRRLPIEAALDLFEERAVDVLLLDEALDRLAQRSKRQAQVVELRFFGGLSIDDVTRVLNISHATVEREWRLARLWLLNELKDEE